MAVYQPYSFCMETNDTFEKLDKLNSEIYYCLKYYSRAVVDLPSTAFYILMPAGTSPLIPFNLNLFSYRIGERMDLLKYLPSPLVLVRNIDWVRDIVRNASLKPSKTSETAAG